MDTLEHDITKATYGFTGCAGLVAEWTVAEHLPERPWLLRLGPKGSEIGYRLTQSEAIALARWINVSARKPK